MYNGLFKVYCIKPEGRTHLRNEFNFWNVHGIMNTPVSYKVSEARIQVIFARDTKYSIMIP